MNETNDVYLGIEPVVSFCDYVDKAMRVRGEGETLETHVVNCGMGLMTELGEIIDIHKRNLMYKTELDKALLMEEIGDLLWYAALGFSSLEIEPLDNPVALTQAVACPSEKVLLGKMAHFCSNFFTMATARQREEWELMSYDLRELLLYTALYCRQMGLSFFDCARFNLVKMKKRYPDGFNIESALNRNKEHELSHLGIS